MKRQQRRKAMRDQNSPKPLHPSFHEYVVTNRVLRRNKKAINNLLKDTLKSGDMNRYNQIMSEINR